MNMEAPLCKIHGKAMREGQYGWFCATKDASGTWCTEKFKAARAPAAQVSSKPVVEPQVLPRVALATAALQFAGAVYHGSGPVGANEAIVLAQTAYGWLVNGEALDVPAF
jgi:hypothetical protein